MRYTACHYGQFENLLSVNKTRERRASSASWAGASGALCRNGRLGLDARARARDRRVQVAQWRVARACQVLGASRVDRACGVYRSRGAILVLAQPMSYRARCVSCSCGALRAAVVPGGWLRLRANLRWPSNLCLRIARVELRLLAVAVPAPRFPHGGFHLRERYADVRA